MDRWSPEEYPARDAWYRSSDWDEDARAEFGRRLGRARPDSRVQYRRIKAIALLHSGDPVREAGGRDLLAQNLAAADAADHEKVIALVQLSKQEQTTGSLDDAERHLREALRIAGPDGSGTSGEEEIQLAEILLEKGGAEAAHEAKQLLDRRASDMPLFVRSRFRLCVVQARVSIALGDGAAPEWADAALTLARETRSGLAQHPTLGLVEADPSTIAWLEDVASHRR